MDTDFDETGRDYDEMWFAHASQLMSIRGLSSAKAAAASLALMRRVFGGEPGFDKWFLKRQVAPAPKPIRGE